MIILDEAAYASADLVFETIFPLLEVECAAFIGISTVLDEFNFFSKLLKLKDEDGDDFFDTIMIDTVCRECKKLPEEEHEKCTHLDDTVLPPWKSKVKYNRSKLLQSVDTNKGRNARESMGLITGDYNQALVTRYVKEIMDINTRSYYTLKKSPKRLYITIDPDGGGKSRLSIISGFIITDDIDELPGTLVITSIDYRQCKDELEQDAVVKGVYDRLRSIKLFEHVPIILIPENQSGFFHRRIERKFKFKNACVFHEYNKEKPGVRKDATKTKDYVIATNDMLEERLIKFMDQWFSIHEKEHPMGREHMASELREEMLRYCYDEHGKLTGKVNGAQDDLYISLGMMCYFAKVIESNPVYANYRIASI